MSEQQKESEASGVAGGEGMSPADSQPTELNAAYGAGAEKPKRRSTTNAKVVSDIDVGPTAPKKARSAKARNVMVSAASSGNAQVEAALEKSDGSKPDSRNLPPLPPAPVPTPEGIAFMQQHVAYQNAVEVRTKHDRARLEKTAHSRSGPSAGAAGQAGEVDKPSGRLDVRGTGEHEDAAVTGPGAVRRSQARQRKAKENSIEAGRDIRKAAISDAKSQAVKDLDDELLLRQMSDRSRLLTAPAKSGASVSGAADAARSDVVALRAMKDPAARKLGIGVAEQNRQADAGYKVAFDKLAPELLEAGELAVGGSSASARSGASKVTAGDKTSNISTAVPESVSKRFLKVDSDYYFPDRSPAFVDHGAKLATRGEHPEVVRALVEIAKERGWDSVTVKGSEAFRRTAWIEAAKNGMQVAGYKPTELDLAQLKQREPNNSIQPSPIRDQGATRPKPLAKSAEEKPRDRTLEEKVTAFANDRPTLVVKKYPELVQAYALLDAARKFAEVHLPGHEDRFVAIGREMITQQISDGKEVVGPRIHPDQVSKSQSGKQNPVSATAKSPEAKEIVRER
jgi:hypothetical protein